MARLWDTEHSTQMGREEAEAEANTDGLRAAIENAPHWTVDDVLTEIGGDRAHRTSNLARELLSLKGNDHPTSRELSSQMRSIQRWVNYEAGVTGKQASRPSKAAQGLLNRAGRNAQAARDGFTIAMSGDIEVNGYKRPDRSASVHLSGDRALSFLNNPNWQDLADAYGVDSLHALGDAEIDISW